MSENTRFVRVSVDDVRSMFYGKSEPTEDDEFVYNCLASLRDFALRTGYNVILDTTAPQNLRREFLLRTRVEDVLGLLVVMIVSKTELDRRNQERRLIGAREAWDQTWEEPSKRMPVMKFRNENQVSFETSYYLLAALLKTGISPLSQTFLGSHVPYNSLDLRQAKRHKA